MAMSFMSQQVLVLLRCGHRLAIAFDMWTGRRHGTRFCITASVHSYV